jgi:CheY-like chemotaxis protein
MAEKILIIDDDFDTLRLVGLMLQKQGYQIVAASDGKQGLLKAMDETPDLILLDVMMPNMDGYEVARRLRQNPTTAGIPILMFTAKSQLDDKVTGFESGADDYLTKPTHPTELQAHVKALLSRTVKMDRISVTEAQAFSVGVVGVRGGLGASSLVLNLGAFLKTNMEKESLVLELTPGTGSIGRDLGFLGFDGATRFLREEPEEITEENLNEALLTHKSGLRILPSSEKPRDMELLNAVLQGKMLFSQLRLLTDYLLVDFGTGLPGLSQALLPQCDRVVVILESFANSTAQAKTFLEDLLDLGVEKERILLVLNDRTQSDLLLSPEQIEQEISFPVALAFEAAPNLFVQAIQKHTPAVLAQPKSLFARQIAELAKLILADEAKQG